MKTKARDEIKISLTSEVIYSVRLRFSTFLWKEEGLKANILRPGKLY